MPLISDHSIVTNPGNIFDPVNGPLASYGTPGDSGSPLYAYDAQEGRWVLVAVLRAYNGDSGATNWWVVLPPDFIREEMAKDSDPAVTFKTDQARCSGPTIAGRTVVLFPSRRAALSLPCMGRRGMI